MMPATTVVGLLRSELADEIRSYVWVRVSGTMVVVTAGAVIRNSAPITGLPLLPWPRSSDVAVVTLDEAAAGRARVSLSSVSLSKRSTFPPWSVVSGFGWQDRPAVATGRSYSLPVFRLERQRLGVLDRVGDVDRDVERRLGHGRDVLGFGVGLAAGAAEDRDATAGLELLAAAPAHQDQ